MSNLRVLLEDRVLVESPRWHDDRLLFADWGSGEVGEIIGLDLAGRAELVAEVEALSCIDRLPDGRLLAISGGSLLRRESDGTFVKHADLGELSTKP